jgi:hypothetical protein
MSFTVGVELCCDYCNEWLGVHHATKKSAWEEAKSCGWKKIKGKHCCEKCLKKSEAE